MRGKHNKTFQTTIIQFLERGYWIQETHDYRDLSVERCLTDGSNDIMSVRQSTILSLLNKGKIEEYGSWTPCLEIDIIKFRLKRSVA